MVVGIELHHEYVELAATRLKLGEDAIVKIAVQRITLELLDNLTLLTPGPQLRGSANVKKGIAAIARESLSEFPTRPPSCETQ